MSTQEALALPSPAPLNTVVINARCSLRIEADQRVIVVGGLPVHHYRAEDAVAEAYAMVFLVESGFAQQSDVARTFARSARTVRRHQDRYAQGGMAALGREEGWRPGRRRISGKRLRSIEMLKSEGMSNRAIAHRLGVSEKAIRKLVGPSEPTASAQLALPEITAAVGKPAEIGVPPATSASDGADRATPSAEDHAGDRDPITAPKANDGEPVPMSLDRDASDRPGTHVRERVGRPPAGRDSCRHDSGDRCAAAAAPTRFLDDRRHAPSEYHDGATVAKTFSLAIEEAAKLHPAAEPLIIHTALLAPKRWCGRGGAARLPPILINLQI